jgi:hypothetical protein
MNIIYLERQLRAGKHPENLGGVIIGKGCQKTAYKIGNYVVKENSGGWRDNKNTPPKGIRKYGARFVRQYRAGKWVLQEFVTPLYSVDKGWQCEQDIREQWQKLYRSNLGDLHECNCGTDAKGKLVVFDW